MNFAPDHNEYLCLIEVLVATCICNELLWLFGLVILLITLTSGLQASNYLCLGVVQPLQGRCKLSEHLVDEEFG
jgi:hypothetical protein